MKLQCSLQSTCNEACNEEMMSGKGLQDMTNPYHLPETKMRHCSCGSFNAANLEGSRQTNKKKKTKNIICYPEHSYNFILVLKVKLCC